MNIHFLTNLFTPTHPKSTMPTPLTNHAPRPIIVKLNAQRRRSDHVGDMLVEYGYQVVRGTSVHEGLRVARRIQPDLIIVFDNLKAGLDGKDWLNQQHSDVSVDNLAMIPLLIVTDTKRLPSLKVHELPGRVKIILKSSGHEHFVPIVNNLLSTSDF